MLGANDGDCENLVIPEGSRVTQIVMEYDTRGVRTLEFILSDGTAKKFGTRKDFSGNLKKEVISLAQGEDIIGLFGKTINNSV